MPRKLCGFAYKYNCMAARVLIPLLACAVGARGAPAAGTLLWNVSVGCHRWGPGCWVPDFSGTDSTPAVSSDGRTVVVGSYDGHVYAVDAASGARKWTVKMDMGVGETTPVQVNRGCFAVCALEEIRCLDEETGDAAWSSRPGGQLASCGAYDASRDALFVGTLDETLWTLRGADGAAVRSAGLGGEIWATHGARVDAARGIVCSGAGGEANVHGNCSATVTCLDAGDGAVLWSARTGAQIQSTPALGASALYVGDYDACLYAFGAGAGEVRWRTCTGGRLESSCAVAAVAGAEAVVVGSGDGYAYAFAGADGALLWRTRLGRPVSALSQGGVGSSPAVVDGVAYVGGPEALFALDVETGAVAWTYAVGKQVGSSPLVRGGRVYVGAEDGYLRAFAL